MSAPHTGLLPRGCEVCSKKEGLLRCSGCQSVWYCGRDHQVADRPIHKTGCVAVKKARAAYEREDAKLRNLPDEGERGWGPDAFEKGAGRFWGIVETRDYMRARHHFVDTVLLFFGGTNGENRVVGRVDAVRLALDHLLDMIRLSRGDNMGIRHIVPGLYLALGRDQEAYDFMKWYATTGASSTYDWGNMGPGFLDVEGADALEAPLEHWLRGRFLQVSHVAAVTLIKVRVLLDLQAIQNSRTALGGTIPTEITDDICGKLVSSIVASRPDILRNDAQQIQGLIQRTKDHIRQLYESIKKSNPHFWELMLDDPDAAGMNRPNMFSPGSKEEACLTIGYSCTSWLATKGAIDVIRGLKETA
ncbi:uncharacterized protein DNG_10278 [Cephalotrichum gorgonifer]|uniref:MYND-type domain-containing protein n=1 Tax=Cephalotrichum gorgonifer TaxID=2041049 RepID=A0AAE8N8W2_9PEZI|nr:uncharacterized protein DNG_10278 [Cephalotrichum gorgonifer]